MTDAGRIPTADHPLRSSRSSEIDGLRCVAMTAVVLLHRGLLPFGWVGVWLFYVISGYVVTLSIIGREPAATGRARLRHFFGRRIVRILPIYYLYVAIGLALAALAGIGQDGMAIASLAGFFNNAAMIVDRGELSAWPTGHLWTISTEMQFYAIYGVTLCLLSRRANVALLIVLLVLAPAGRMVASILLASAGWSPGPLAFAIYAGPGLHADVFAMGALLAFAAKRWPIERLARPLSIVGSGVLALYVCAYLAVNRHVRAETGVTMLHDILSGVLQGEYREVVLYTVIGLVGTGLVALAAARDPLVRWLLGHPTVRWIGTISYGGYVYHGLVLQSVLGLYYGRWTGQPMPGVAVNLVAFAVSFPLIVLIAWLSFRFLETPLNQRLGAERRLWSRPGRR